MKLDLNARRADRASAHAEPKIMVLNDREYALVDELPMAVMEYAAELELGSAVKAMLVNPDDWSELVKVLTLEDVAEIVAMYGASLGESLASTSSSANTGGLSGPTSNGSTASTSRSVSTGPSL
jgi:hypothetical protein